MNNRLFIAALILGVSPCSFGDDFAKKAGVASRIDDLYVGTYFSEDRSIRLNLKKIDAFRDKSPTRLRYGKHTIDPDGSLRVPLLSLEKQGSIIDLQRALTGKKSSKKPVLREHGELTFPKSDTDSVTFTPKGGEAVVLKKLKSTDP